MSSNITNPQQHLLTTQPKPTANIPDDAHEMPSEESMHPLSCFLGTVCCPFSLGATILSSFFSLPPKTEVIVLRYGKYQHTLKEAGLYYSNIFGRDLRFVSTQYQSMDLKGSTVLDHNGNPLIVASIIVYQFVNSYRAAVMVQNAHQFLSSQAESVLKNVISEYPYETPNGTNQRSLRSNAVDVNSRLREVLQARINVAGILIHSFDIKEITYSPVIAAVMLKRQQAAAVVQARQTIVEGAVEIASSAVDQLRHKGIELPPAEATRLVSNLLTVICSESEVQPTLPLTV